MKTTALIMCFLMLTGCAFLRDRMSEIGARNNPNADYVEAGISKSDAIEVTQDMANFMASQFPAAKTTIRLAPRWNALHDNLREQLSRRGFGVAESETAQGVALGYYVTPLDRGLLVRMRFHGKTASRYYDRQTDGHLSLHSRFTVRVDAVSTSGVTK